jgi:predicted amidophosphoribosyltransferase
MRAPLGRLGDLWDALADLVLPSECAGCAAGRVSLRYGVCAGCAADLAALRPSVARPTPPPPGLPMCIALGEYAGPLRGALVAYKDRGRHGLARPLGALLAEAVAVAAMAHGDRAPPVLLVPVPDTAAAARRRHGDHLRRLTRYAAARLQSAGWTVAVAHPLRALPRPDSATLDRAGRAAAADAFRVRPRRAAALRRLPTGTALVLLDDVMTTGATLAAVSARLGESGVPVRAAATLAATRRRN